MSDTDLKKTERLASAIYLVSSFFDDKEPMKWRLRTLSANLVAERVKDKSNIAREMLSLLSVAKTAGMVTETNHEILVRELSNFEREERKPLEALFLPEAGPVVERNLPQPQAHRPEPEQPVTARPIKDKTSEQPALREFGAVSVKKNTRKSIIIGLLKRKKGIMIKDVVPLISGVSEKTIQRELLAMVQEGILKKTGEKRWSRYSLA